MTIVLFVIVQLHTNNTNQNSTLEKTKNQTPTTLQKTENIEMKKAPGKIGGTIIADNNKYENYFLRNYFRRAAHFHSKNT